MLLPDRTGSSVLSSEEDRINLKWGMMHLQQKLKVSPTIVPTGAYLLSYKKIMNSMVQSLLDIKDATQENNEVHNVLV